MGGVLYHTQLPIQLHRPYRSALTDQLGHL
jgi:hypothetical protein